MKSTSSRLFLDKEGAADTITSVQSVLWDTALRIEDGEVSIAARDLQELQRKLEEALARDASDEELEQLMDELQAALDRYLDAMAKQMQEQMARQGEHGADGDRPGAHALPPEPPRHGRAGAGDDAERRQTAREMLSQLQQMMENMRAGVQPRMSPQQQAMQEMMRQLSELTRRQQELMDDTYRNQQNQAAGATETGAASSWGKAGSSVSRVNGAAICAGAEVRGSQGMIRRASRGRTEHAVGSRQDPEALRRALGDFMRKLGNGMSEIPEGFGRANQAMRNARDALRGNEPGEAVGPQGDALDSFGRARSHLLVSPPAIGQRPGAGQQNAEGNQQGRDERDPLNRSRNTGGTANDSNRVGIPTESDVMRAREIFDELRRRSGDQSARCWSGSTSTASSDGSDRGGRQGAGPENRLNKYLPSCCMEPLGMEALAHGERSNTPEDGDPSADGGTAKAAGQSGFKPGFRQGQSSLDGLFSFFASTGSGDHAGDHPRTSEALANTIDPDEVKALIRYISRRGWTQADTDIQAAHEALSTGSG